MKLFLFIFCNLLSGFSIAQDCREHLLMQKGVLLEYKEYWFDSSRNVNWLGSNKAISQMLFEVNQVKDSAGSTWSTIIKKGKGVFDSTDHCERKIVLQCDGKHLLIPYQKLCTGDFFRQLVIVITCA